MTRLFEDAVREAPQWGASLLVHVLVLLFLAAFYVDLETPPRMSVVVTELDDLEEIEEFPEELIDEEEIELHAPVALLPQAHSGGIADAGAGAPNPVDSMRRLAAATAAIGDRRLNRPLSAFRGALTLGSNIRGIKGINEFQGDGDTGSIDRITAEILRQLEKNKVLVVWIMDASGSLEQRRDAIAKRLDRIYRELDELGVNERDGLLTAVVSAGERVNEAIKPTNDQASIRKAIRAIEDDESGVENLFTAVRTTALKYRGYQTAGRRSLMIILLTDEIGDDDAMADEAVALLKRNRVPVYVMGPMATFNRPVVHDSWTDAETGHSFPIPIERGPYTREEEFLRVPFNSTPHLSGWGPFALTQLTRESGGIFFLYDDGRISGPKYDMEILIRYKADYEPEGEYARRINQSELRRTLIDVAREGNALWHPGWPFGWIHSKNSRRDLEARQNDVARFSTFAERAIPAIKAVLDRWESETHPRWRANFDLTYARLLFAKVRCDEFNWACADFKADPLTLEHPKRNNGWHYAFVDEIHIGAPTGGGSKEPEKPAGKSLRRAEPKAAIAARAMIETARFHFRRVMSEHDGTPWAVAAAIEIVGKPGFAWREGRYAPFDYTPEDLAKRRDAAMRRPNR